jgi:uncharacterized membrane protein YtjA (UPF0391 family)
MNGERTLQFAGLLFGVTLLAAFMGFGGVLATGPEFAKAVAVVGLVLFFVSLYRGLYRAP